MIIYKQGKQCLLFTITTLLLFCILVGCGSGNNTSSDHPQSTPGVNDSSSSITVDLSFISAATSGSLNLVSAGNDGNLLITPFKTFNWQQVNIPHSTNFITVAYGGGQFLTAGLGGQVYASFESQAAESTAWRLIGDRDNQPSGNIRGAVYFNSPVDGDGFVLVDDQGYIYFTRAMYARDNNISVLTSTPESAPLFAVTRATNNHTNILVAVGGGGLILTSTDGHNWNDKSIAHNHKSLYGVAGSPTGIVVAVGESGIVTSSVDGGNTWDTTTIPGYESTTLTNINYSGHEFIITTESEGQVLMASDQTGVLSSWSKVPTNIDGSTYAATSFPGGKVIAGESALIARWSPGQFMQDTYNPAPDADIKDVVYLGNQTFALLGSQHSNPQNGYIGTYQYNNISNQWTLINGTSPNGLTQINDGVYVGAQGKLVTVGNNGQISYTNNVTGLPNGLVISSPTTPINYTLNGVDYFDGEYAIAGYDPTTDHGILYSNDPQTGIWSDGKIKIGSDGGRNKFHKVFSITHDDTQFIAAADSYIYNHPYLVTWQNIDKPSEKWQPYDIGMNQNFNKMHDIFYAKSKVFMVGDTGIVSCFYNGVWYYQLTITPQVTANLYKTGYDYNASQYIITGDNGTIVTIFFEPNSSNINDFTSTVENTVSNSLHGVSCGGGLCVAAGDNGSLVHREFKFIQTYPQK